MFKLCNVCNHKWMNRQDFMVDPDIVIIGYQVNFDRLEAGHFYFNHSCNNTIVLSANLFADLHEGPIFAEPRTGLEDCPGYCLKKEALEPCQAECECAYIRSIMQLFNRADSIRIV